MVKHVDGSLPLLKEGIGLGCLLNRGKGRSAVGVRSIFRSPVSWYVYVVYGFPPTLIMFSRICFSSSSSFNNSCNLNYILRHKIVLFHDGAVAMTYLVVDVRHRFSRMASLHVTFRHAGGCGGEVAVLAAVALVVQVSHHVTSHVGALAQTRVLSEVTDLAFIVQQTTGWNFL